MEIQNLNRVGISKKYILKSSKEVEKYILSEKQEYYASLREACNNLRTKALVWNKIIVLMAPVLRNFEIEIRGIGNIPEENAVFVANHSNSHDYFVTKEVFAKIGRNVTPLGAWDGLSALSRLIFKMGDVTFIDRADKKTSEKGILNFCGKILRESKDGIIFGEGTWNLHPIRPMLAMKAGAIQVSFITGKPIVPVIFEYVEVPKECRKERDLYTKCVVQFGRVIYPDMGESVFEQTQKVMRSMISMRENLWEEFGINVI